MFRVYTLVGSLFITSAVLHAQTTPIELWRTPQYTESISLRGPSIVLDKYQNVYMLTNESDLNPFGGFNLVKYDSLGLSLWNRHYPPSFAGYFYGSFTVDSLGYAYVSPNFDGGLEQYDAPAILVKYSPNGDKLWEANYSINQTGDEYLLYSDLDPFGRLIVVGRNEGIDSSPLNDFIFVSSIDTATGEELWRTKISGNFMPNNLRVHAEHIELLAIKYAPGYSDYVILQLDFNGVILEEHTNVYPQYGLVQWSYISKNSDVLLGTSYSGYEVARVTATGDTLWHYQYPNTNSSLGNHWIRHVTEDDSSFVFATGLIRLPGLSAEMMTTKLSPSGEVIWQRIYHSANDSLGDEGNYLVFNDSIVVVAGATQLANRDVVGVINVYANINGEELYNILLGYDNIFVIDQVQLVNNKIYYSGEGFNASIDEMKVITGCIKLPVFTSSLNSLLHSTMKVFPNPTADRVTISQLDQSVFTHWEVLDIDGKVLMSSNIERETVSIGLLGYPAGIYIISVKGKNIVLNKKVVKI